MNSNPNNQVLYIESSIRPGLTIGEYRRSRPRRPNRWERAQAARRRRAACHGVAAEALAGGA